MIAQFEEYLHPRGRGGKFASKGGLRRRPATKAGAAPASAAPVAVVDPAARRGAVADELEKRLDGMPPAMRAAAEKAIGKARGRGVGPEADPGEAGPPAPTLPPAGTVQELRGRLTLTSGPERRRKAEEDQFVKQVAAVAEKYPSPASRASLNKALNDQAAAYLSLKAKVAAERGAALDEIARFTGGGHSTKFEVSGDSTGAKKRVGERLAGVTALLGKVLPEGLTDMRAVNVSAPRGQSRAFADGLRDGVGQMTVTSDTDASSVIHEYGHLIESASRAHFEAAVDFLHKRTEGEQPRKLSELTGNDRYGGDEVAKEDKFHSPYVGKVYPSDDADSYRGVYATEVTSMGMERLFNDPAGFAHEDPEYFDFMVGQITRRKQSGAGPA